MRHLTILLSHDIRLLLRANHVLVATFGFAFLLIVVSSFSFRYVGITAEQIRLTTPGILWVVFLFTSVIGLNHSFAFEKELGAIRGVLLTPVDHGTVYLAKFMSNLIFLFLLQSFIILVHGIFFGVDYFGNLAELLLLSLLVVVGFSSFGTLLSGIAASLNGRDILLPLILFPVCIPLVIAVVELTRELLLGGSLNFDSFWFTLLCVVDVIGVIVSWVLFEYVVNE